MKTLKITLLAFCINFMSFAQVGIGTTTPQASSILDLTATNKALLLTRVANTGTISTPINGMLIYDISSNCVKIYQNSAWSDCIGTPATPAVTNDCAINGFEGTYTSGFAMAAANKFTVTITNNSFSTANISFATTDLVLSGVSGLSVSAVSPATASLNAGQSQLVTYTLAGTPTSVGTLTGTWTKLSLNCVKTKSVSGISALLTSNYCTNATINGSYVSGIVLSASNTFSVTLTNNSSSAITGMPAPTLSNLASTYSGSGAITVASVSPSATYNLAIGASQTITYTLSGTPSSSGTLTLNWSYGDLVCQKLKNIGLGDATFTNVKNNTYVFSANDPSVPINSQGTLAIGTTVLAPYTSGLGSYLAYTSSFTAIPAAYCEDGASDWTFGYSYAAGTFSTTGNLTITLITKKGGVITAWPAKRVGTISTINFNCTSLALNINGNSISNTVGIDEGGDVIRGAIALGGGASAATYDAAAVNDVVKVTAAEFNQLQNIVAGMTNFGRVAADDNIPSPGTTSFVNNMIANTIPIGAYPFAFTTLLDTNSSGVTLIYQAGDSAVGSYWSSGSCYLFTPSAVGLYYFVIKRPSVSKTTSTQKLAVKGYWNGWGANGGGHGCDGCASNTSSIGGSENSQNCSLISGAYGGTTTGSFPTNAYLNYSIKYTTLKQW
jgi:hypothetical protein